MTPSHFAGAPAFTMHQGGWITVQKRRFFLKKRLSVVYITRPVFTGIGLQFVLRHPGGVDQNVSREIHAEEPGIVCCKPIKTAKRVLLLVL